MIVQDGWQESLLPSGGRRTRRRGSSSNGAAVVLGRDCSQLTAKCRRHYFLSRSPLMMGDIIYIDFLILFHGYCTTQH